MSDPAFAFPCRVPSAQLLCLQGLAVFCWLVSLPGTLSAAAAEPTPIAPGEPVFVDRAAHSGLDFTHFNGRSGQFYMLEINSPGCGLFDYDNDGDLDVYLVQGSRLGEQAGEPPAAALPLTDRLYRNDLETGPDGRPRLHFVDVTAASKLAASGYGFGVFAADYDNDGWVDLYLSQFGSNQLWRNLGNGQFADVTAAAGVDDPRWSVPAAWFDAQGDGWLDLYVGGYLDFAYDNNKICRAATGARDFCGPNSFNGISDRLFVNRGDGTFADRSLRSRIGAQSSKSLGVVVADLDDDGRPDLYITNDGSPNQMWLQQADGTFRDESLLAGTAVNADGRPEASMGVDAQDFDGDGDLDLFMTHLAAETNTLYRNEGDGLFEDVTQQSGLGLPSWTYTSWGTAGIDYDNDGWLDLLVVNGAVRSVEALVRAGDPFPFHQRNQLFRNLGGGRFVETTAEGGPPFELSEVSRGAAFGDIDNDGDIDVLMSNNSGPVRLLINQIGHNRQWFGIRLLSHGRDALGARVGLERPGKPTLWRRVRVDGSFASSSDPRVVFGLGDSSVIGKLTVRWPGGRVETWSGLAVGRYTTLVEGQGKAPAEEVKR